MEHSVQRPEQHTDPILGPVWVRVGCELCGAVGRYDSEGIASAHADKHNRILLKGGTPLKVCDFCLEEQGVMNVQVHPNAQVLPVSVRWGTGRDELDFHIDLCVAHREMIERCYNRRFAS